MSVNLSLTMEVTRFRAWADQYPHSERGGEWECDYFYWRDLWTAAIDFLAQRHYRIWTDEEIQDILYALARDNETETISEAIAENDKMLLFVAEKSLEYGEDDAKWQVAARIGERRLTGPRFESVLLRFFSENDEYVCRRALIALGQVGSRHVRRCVESAWATGQEYQRIACLWALKDARAPGLKDYLEFAKSDGRKYVVQNAKEIEEKWTE